MSKITFKNGTSLELSDGDSPEAGRGLTPFVPHPCQEEEFRAWQLKKDEYEIEVRHYQKDDVTVSSVSNINLEDIRKSWEGIENAVKFPKDEKMLICSNCGEGIGVARVHADEILIWPNPRHKCIAEKKIYDNGCSITIIGVDFAGKGQESKSVDFVYPLRFAKPED